MEEEESWGMFPTLRVGRHARAPRWD